MGMLYQIVKDPGDYSSHFVLTIKTTNFVFMAKISVDFQKLFLGCIYFAQIKFLVWTWWK